MTTKKLSAKEAQEAFDALFTPHNKPKRSSKPSVGPSPTITHIYTVRRHWGGTRFRVSIETKTISMFEAEMNCEAFMRANRYIEPVLIDVVKSQ